MALAVDSVGLVLSIIETILLFIGLIFYVLSTYTIITDKLLHANFRMVLCFILFRSVLIPGRRLPTLYWRIFIIGEETVPFIKLYNDLSLTTSNLLCTCLLVLSIERLLYTHVKLCSRNGLLGGAIVLGILVASNGLLFLSRRLWPSTIFPVTFLIAAPSISFVLLIWVFRINLRRRKVIDAANLDEKAEANRGMNAVRIFLPAMFISSALTMSVGIISMIQLIWIPSERVGAAESKLNNIFGLISAVDALFTPLVVVVRHKQLKATYLKRINSQIGNKSVTTDEHLKQFAVQWKVAT